MDIPEVDGVEMPKPKDILSAQQRDGKNFMAKEIYEETWQWLKKIGCHTVVSPQVIERYTKVPKVLSILPQIQTEMLSSVKAREGGRIYVEVSGDPSYINLEQVKNMSTKTVFVDDLDDVKIQKLSNEDIVMLKRSKK